MAKVNNTPHYKLQYPEKKEDFLKTKDGVPIVPDEYRAVELLNQINDYRYNVIQSNAEIRKVGSKDWKLLNDKDINTLNILCRSKNISIKKDFITSILESDYIYIHHPFKEYFDSLPVWDGNDHIGQLAGTLKSTNDELTRLYVERWLVGVCKCAYEDKYVNDYSLVLVGKEGGTGKTRWVKKLVPTELQLYFHEGYINLNDKDSIKRLSTGFITLLDEIDSYGPKETAKLKAHITQSDIIHRNPYGRRDSKYYRTTNFVSTTNSLTYLTDDSGARRMLSIEVVNIDYQHTVDINKVYAQAFYLANESSYTPYFTSEETNRIKESNNRFQFKSELQFLIEEEFSISHEGDDNAVFMTSTDITQHLKFKDDIGKFDSSIVGKLMRRMGHERKHKGSDKNKRYGYFVILKNLPMTTAQTMQSTSSSN